MNLHHSFAPLREISTTTSRPAATLQQRLTDKLGSERLTPSWTFQAGERDGGSLQISQTRPDVAATRRDSSVLIVTRCYITSQDKSLFS